MKTSTSFFAIFLRVFGLILTGLVSCAPTAPPPDRAPTSVTDDGVKYPRTFTASMQMIENARGQVVAQTSWDARQANVSFGCSEGSAGADFVFFMKSGDEALRIQVRKAYFRESKSIYSDLLDVELLGTVAGQSFDRSRQQYQLQSCSAQVQRRGQNLSGTFSCADVVPVGSNNQARFDLQFSCEIVPR